MFCTVEHPSRLDGVQKSSLSLLLSPMMHRGVSINVCCIYDVMLNMIIGTVNICFTHFTCFL